MASATSSSDPQRWGRPSIYSGIYIRPMLHAWGMVRQAYNRRGAVADRLPHKAGGYLTPSSRFSCASASSQFLWSCPTGRPFFSQICRALSAICPCVSVAVGPACRCPAAGGACGVTDAGFATGSPPTGSRRAAPTASYDRFCFDFALVAFGVRFRDIQSLHPRSCTTSNQTFVTCRYAPLRFSPCSGSPGQSLRRTIPRNAVVRPDPPATAPGRLEAEYRKSYLALQNPPEESARCLHEANHI